VKSTPSARGTSGKTWRQVEPSAALGPTDAKFPVRRAVGRASPRRAADLFSGALVLGQIIERRSMPGGKRSCELLFQV
jgi:hypothetical protein